MQAVKASLAALTMQLASASESMYEFKKDLFNARASIEEEKRLLNDERSKLLLDRDIWKNKHIEMSTELQGTSAKLKTTEEELLRLRKAWSDQTTKASNFETHLSVTLQAQVLAVLRKQHHSLESLSALEQKHGDMETLVNSVSKLTKNEKVLFQKQAVSQAEIRRLQLLLEQERDDKKLLLDMLLKEQTRNTSQSVAFFEEHYVPSFKRFAEGANEAPRGI
jgi:hypothetical protein